MAIKLGHDGDDFAETHEINVPPFIDVILVLLIIFMIAAPLATVDVPVDLPISTAAPQRRPDKPLFLTVKPDLTLLVGPGARLQATVDVHPATLAEILRERFGPLSGHGDADPFGLVLPLALGRPSAEVGGYVEAQER